MIKMSKRQQQQLEKRSAGFMEEFKKLLYRHQAWEVWSDFCTMAAISIANAVDKRHFEAREKLYLDTIKRYTKEEQQVFPILFAETVMELERNPDQDFLGKMFMQLELGNHWKGQFFTPYNVCHLMAEMNMDAQVENIEEKGWISVSDCACGAGAMLIAFASVCRKKEINYQQCVMFVAQDLDPVAAYMCYIQLSLLGCPGYVKIGDSLSEPLVQGDETKECVWSTPMYFSQVWQTRRWIEWMKSLCPPQEKQNQETEPAILIKYHSKSQMFQNIGGITMAMEQLNKQMEQCEKGSLEHCIGMELMGLCKGNEGAAEIVEQDLAKKGMTLSDCAKKIRDYARNHQKGGFFEMDDALSEKLICEFYGISKAEASAPEAAPEEPQEEQQEEATELSFSLEDLL